MSEHTKLQQISIKIGDSMVIAVLRCAQPQHKGGKDADWMIRHQKHSEIMGFT